MRLAELKVRPDGPFRIPEAIQEALTHSSFAAENGGAHNERLEMLGDAVLGFLVTDMLFDLYPEAPEGDLTRLRASLVDREALAGQGRALGLGDLIAVGRGEEISGGRARNSLLADAFEAVIAALYRSEGLPMTASLVQALFRSGAVDRADQASQPTDFKTRLQERTQAAWKVQPSYRITESRGPDHNRTFVSEAVLRGKVIGTGEGHSKKIAEQQAAKSALLQWDIVEQAVASELQ
jgi:ribonuclease III